ncbi:hypothetical protein DRW03_28220 [Corallococcus sp. H22C18031201]|uniref:hypothetical protein n=1 Tax=Citreicoccus inhibens TaxID=2849499 RepID=UPI000E75D416|nr:hypothetical protein [Citreicoccus inhibens]MBU8899100.1 hypothetical protein [Citreicoccus inhibens]RJS17427.1 hypothetical protein DRW03_28220 [Corallococcus sp. H22C18031201]
MTLRRLVFFVSDVEGPLPALPPTLQRVCDALDVPPPEAHWVPHRPDGLADAGWHVAEVPLPGGKGPSPEEHLDAIAKGLAQECRERTLGLYVDREHSYARACLAVPGYPARASEGEYLDVVRQGARWLGVETPTLSHLFSGDAARNLLAAAVDFGSGGAATQPLLPAPAPVPDEDDLFVEAKLAQARAYMEQYRGMRK